MDVTDLLARAVEAGASDLHLAAGQVPMLRLDGELQRMDAPPLLSAALSDAMTPLLADEQCQQWAQGDELDVALQLPALGRFRLNLFRQLNGLAATFRVIPKRIATLDELDLGEVFLAVAQCTDGLVLVGGPTGSGKSSTLAALLDQLNRERPVHIITLEDPIEVIHSSQRSLVNQREIGRHCGGFAQGLRSALRQDPDVIVIGELRDLQTIRLALRAAETGHLVLATVHTRSAINSIDRLVEVFAAEEKPLVRAMLAESLRVVVAQVLVKRVGGGRVAAREVLVANTAVRNLIREGRLAQLQSVMQSGAAAGMRTMEAALRELHAKGLTETL
ncbi:PilT/PilU family type 4a pilus ATPase [Pseudomonas sp. P1B16]|jgi:twitching motility protein PilT|uniref:PilT/PilU family type 4a pilus ATPase n=1 Tax=Pseudomonas capeferrum TaxID=1495066 RepID=A0ABY7R834_9PSED|nr:MULTISPECIES: PilT/PilU family type 4a pilus ATPase [Pseudomonas]KGI94097.1 twitching motility protein PilT [Pseudomonas sp. H2]MBC3501508.1 PilT/PilU family type 4a pilus ATPase [Pseudomonas sp. SWRI59]MBC3506627.1 PilT/PilU family type 4a pilus ATPase [Pseudomonas sp. SWRI68]MDD2061682.1 PilT/PilU family type 4a pilus ATPase [Pseudomonas sp. 25571]MDD2128001.1 PilT/PilU family type 4a pilus ATPase [Pseudomonas sp. 17391]